MSSFNSASITGRFGRLTLVSPHERTPHVVVTVTARPVDDDLPDETLELEFYFSLFPGQFLENRLKMEALLKIAVRAEVRAGGLEIVEPEKDIRIRYTQKVQLWYPANPELEPLYINFN